MMRLLALLLPFIVVLSGCGFVDLDPSGGTTGVALDLEVHLTSQFNDDHVRVAIDGREVFDERVTTVDVLSLAEVVELKSSSGRHRIDVDVNGSYHASERFYLDRPKYAIVRFYKEPLPRYQISEGILIDVTDRRPVYD